MKKMMLGLAMMVMVITSAFATENVNTKVLNAFRTDFIGAEDVTWTTGAGYHKAAFTLSGQRIFAYYSFSGGLMGVARYITTLQLPLNLISELKNSYSEFWVSDLFEVNNDDGTHYYITLEDADNTIILKSSNGFDWMEYSKKKKV